MGKAAGRLSCFCWRNTAGVVEPPRKEEALKHPEKCLLGQCPTDATDQAKKNLADNQAGHEVAQKATQMDLVQSTVDALEDASRDLNEAAVKNAAEKPAEGAPLISVTVEGDASAETQEGSGEVSTQMHALADASPKNALKPLDDDNQRTASQETTTASDAKDARGDDRIVSGETETYRETSEQQSPVQGPSDANCTAEQPLEVTKEGKATEQEGESEDKKEDESNKKEEGNEPREKGDSEHVLDSTPMPQTTASEPQPNPAVAESKNESESRTLELPASKELSPQEEECERPAQKESDEGERPLENVLEEARPSAVTADDTPVPLTQPETQATAKDVDTTKSESSQDEKTSSSEGSSPPDDVVSAVTTNSQVTPRRSSQKKKKAKKTKGKRRHGRTGRR